MPSPETNRHHILWSQKQYQQLGGVASTLRDLPNLIARMPIAEHDDLHYELPPPHLRPLEHARMAFTGLEPLTIVKMDTLGAVEYLIGHFNRVSDRATASDKTRKIANNLGANLASQMPYFQKINNRRMSRP